MRISNKSSLRQSEEIRLDIHSFIPRSSMIRNTLKVIGLVVYVGKDTKIMKNMQQRVFKQSALDKTMKRYIFLIMGFLLVLLLILSFVALGKQMEMDYDKEILGDGVSLGVKWIYVFLAYLVLMNIILPISLVVTLQILKIVQNLYFLREADMHEPEVDKFTKINSANLNDQLGQVQYILSDKTGTLTQNKMQA